MPSELEVSILARLDVLEKQVAALTKKVAGLSKQPAAAQRRAPEEKEEGK